MPKTTRYLLADLFCGCGGLSRGLERTGRFTSVFGVDNNKSALETFVKNHGGGEITPSSFFGDIRQLTIEEVWRELNKYGIEKPGDLDCLVGGPPCEGFSRNKVYTRRKDGEESAKTENGYSDPRALQLKQYDEPKYWQTAWQAPARTSTVSPDEREVLAYNPFLDDPRNYLFRYFLKIVGALRPKIVLIENVRQMLLHKEGAIANEIIARLRRLGYAAEARVLNAAHFGVPQLRQRVFFVCVKKEYLKSGLLLPWPTPTHSERAGGSLFSSQTDLPGDAGFFVNTFEAIADLPPARPEHEGNGRLPVQMYPDVPLSQFRLFVRSSVATPANHVYRTPSEQVIARLRAMKPGMKPHDLPRELQTKKYYYNAYGRLEWDRPANTITKSFLYPGSGKFGHPEEDRVISYREAARLQSFDDDFTFYATSQEGTAHMIGGAVPPLLGYRFGQQFAALLDELTVAVKRA